MADKEIAKLVIDIQARLDDLEKGLKTAETKGTKAAERIKKSFGSLAGTLGIGLGTAALVGFGKEAVMVAAKAEGVQTAFNRLNKPGLLDNLRKATRGTVSDLELMQVTIRAKNFKIPLDTLAKGLEFATNRAIQSGQSVDYLVNSIVDGIGRKSSLVLDNLGISASELQEELKKTGDFGKAAGVIMERGLSEAGEVADTTLTKIQRLNAEWENLKKETGSALIDIADFFDSIDKSITKTFDQSEYVFLLRRIFGTEHGQHAKALGFEITIPKDASFKPGSENTGSSNSMVQTVGDIKAAIEELKKKQDELVPGSKELQDNLSKIKELEEKINFEVKKREVKLRDLGAAYDELIKKQQLLLNPDSALMMRAKAGNAAGLQSFAPATDVSFDAGFREPGENPAPSFDEFARNYIQAFIEQGQLAANVVGAAFSTMWSRTFGEANSLFEQLAQNMARQLTGKISEGLFSTLFAVVAAPFTGGASLAALPATLGQIFPGFATGADFTVPSKYTNDSFFFRANANERVQITPQAKASRTDSLLTSISNQLTAVNSNLIEGRSGGAFLSDITIDGKKIGEIVFGIQNKFKRAGVNLNEL